MFSSTLGIERDDWRYLHDQLLEGLVEAPVLGTRVTPFGVLYEVVVLVDGLNGRPRLSLRSGSSRASRRRDSSRPGWISHEQMPHFQVMSDLRHAVLDVVELLTASGRWAAGTAGTIVEADDQHALVEIADDRGHATDFVSLPHEQLTSVDDRSARAAS